MSSISKFIFVTAFSGLFFLLPAYGQLGSPLQVSPTLPLAGDPIEAIVLFGSEPAGFCIDSVPNLQGLSFDVTQDGNLLILDLSTRSIIAPPCPPGLPPTPRTYPLGEFPAGEYRLQLNRVISATSFPAAPADRIFIDEIEFIVAPGGLPVSVNSSAWLALLVICILLLVFFHKRLPFTD